MNRRTLIKWLHWLSFALLIYFFAVEPDDDMADAGAALSTHAGAGVLLALVTGIWLFIWLRKGLMGRAGPKLPGPTKQFHRLNHIALQIGVPIVVASGAFAGLAAPFAIRAFDVLPINPGFGGKGIHDFATEIHEIVFDALIVLIIVHALFHIWRHLRLKDNALRIMVPKILHRWL